MAHIPFQTTRARISTLTGTDWGIVPGDLTTPTAGCTHDDKAPGTRPATAGGARAIGKLLTSRTKTGSPVEIRHPSLISELQRMAEDALSKMPPPAVRCSELGAECDLYLHWATYEADELRAYGIPRDAMVSVLGPRWPHLSPHEIEALASAASLDGHAPAGVIADELAARKVKEAETRAKDAARKRVERAKPPERRKVSGRSLGLVLYLLSPFAPLESEDGVLRMFTRRRSVQVDGRFLVSFRADQFAGLEHGGVPQCGSTFVELVASDVEFTLTEEQIGQLSAAEPPREQLGWLLQVRAPTLTKEAPVPLEGLPSKHCLVLFAEYVEARLESGWMTGPMLAREIAVAAERAVIGLRLNAGDCHDIIVSGVRAYRAAHGLVHGNEIDPAVLAGEFFASAVARTMSGETRWMRVGELVPANIPNGLLARAADRLLAFFNRPAPAAPPNAQPYGFSSWETPKAKKTSATHVQAYAPILPGVAAPTPLGPVIPREAHTVEGPEIE